MLFLADEDSASEVLVAELKRLGHTVYLSTALLFAGATDHSVALHAENIGAIVVTRNKKDFWRILAPRPATTPRQFRRAGALFVMCESKVSVGRLAQFDVVLRAEHERATKVAPDPRFLVELLPDKVVIHR